MNKKQRKNLIRIVLTVLLLALIGMSPLAGMAKLAAYFAACILIGGDILRKAGIGILHREPLDENLLMSLASLGAFALAAMGTEDFFEAVAILLFYQIGVLFEGYAVGKSRRDIGALMDIRPDYANVWQDGKLVRVDPDAVGVGTEIVVQPGERVPIDGIVMEGESTLSTSALTGESLPQEIGEGQEALSGCINLTRVLRIRTTKPFEESTASKILELVEEASSRKSRAEVFITRFARIYTPAVVSGAVLLAVALPIMRLAFGMAAEWEDWGYRALIFLVISCPCALVVSVPLAFFASLGAASRAGVLVKGSNFLEMLADVRTVAMDKTGTLTRGAFEVRAVHHSPLTDQELLEIAALAESASSHPISRSLRKAHGREIDRRRVMDVEEIGGSGVLARIDGRPFAIGNERLMARVGASYRPCHHAGTIVHVAEGKEYLGHIVIADVVKPEAKAAMEALRASGVRRLVMLTGDGHKAAEEIAAALSFDLVRSELLPKDKVTSVERLLADAKKGERVAFVGDGINDAPVLARADVGIAMGAMGSDAAIEAADVVLMDDDLRKLAKAVRIARRCMGIVRTNIAASIGIKVICLVLGAFGLADLWLAIFADTGVLVLATLNAVRVLFVKEFRSFIKSS